MAKKFVTLSVNRIQRKLYTQDIRKVHNSKARKLPTIPIYQRPDDEMPKFSDEHTDISESVCFQEEQSSFT